MTGLTLCPHGPHLCSNVSRRDCCLCGTRNHRFRFWPSTAGEVLCDRIWNEARTLGIDMPVARTGLSVCVEPLRHHQMQVVLGASHRDIEEAPLLFDFGA